MVIGTDVEALFQNDVVSHHKIRDFSFARTLIALTQLLADDVMQVANSKRGNQNGIFSTLAGVDNTEGAQGGKIVRRIVISHDRTLSAATHQQQANEK
jgi:hypothetical protein